MKLERKQTTTHLTYEAAIALLMPKPEDDLPPRLCAQRSGWSREEYVFIVASNAISNAFRSYYRDVNGDIYPYTPKLLTYTRDISEKDWCVRYEPCLSNYYSDVNTATRVMLGLQEQVTELKPKLSGDDPQWNVLFGRMAVRMISPGKRTTYRYFRCKARRSVWPPSDYVQFDFDTHLLYYFIDDRKILPYTATDIPALATGQHAVPHSGSTGSRATGSDLFGCAQCYRRRPVPSNGATNRTDQTGVHTAASRTVAGTYIAVDGNPSSTD